MQYSFLFYIVEFNMTTVAIDSKMAALFDGNNDTCEDIQDIVTKRSDLKLTKLNNVVGTVAFDVKVQGLNSCSSYGFVYALVKNDSCDFVRSCNVTHDLATSHNSCIVNCPCEENCFILAFLYSSSNNASGIVCEIKLL